MRCSKCSIIRPWSQLMYQLKNCIGWNGRQQPRLIEAERPLKNADYGKKWQSLSKCRYWIRSIKVWWIFFWKVFLLMVMLDLISENRLMGWITFLNVIQKKKEVQNRKIFSDSTFRWLLSSFPFGEKDRDLVWLENHFMVS